ncbi:unnamed protein product [Oikopleura dioica]|uniref:Uncharacterized protein n=1 Tax=Oikopleura dioica TaxID=34765 RepID=E4XMG7_OIKDI|nr:unnamed protein product [Oikopleura dioica]
MERVISQNIHQSQLSRYRCLLPLDQNGKKTVDESDMTDFDHGLIRLWSFKDEQLKGFNVNSIGFNSVGPEIVAVEYGHSQRAKGASKIPGIMLGELLLLIKVKRTSKKTKKNRSNTRKTDNAVISQLSPATSFNFNPTDGNT